MALAWREMRRAIPKDTPVSAFVRSDEHETFNYGGVGAPFLWDLGFR
jgi:hypothetical protein